MTLAKPIFRHSADLEHFIDALQFLHQEAEIEVKTIALMDSWAELKGETAFCFPETIRKVRSWHIMSIDPLITRRILIARISLQNKTYYALELERKSDTPGTMILRNGGYDDIPDKMLFSFLLATARNNRWPRIGMFHNLVGATFSHTESAEKFAARMSQRLQTI